MPRAVGLEVVLQRVLSNNRHRPPLAGCILPSICQSDRRSRPHGTGVRPTPTASGRQLRYQDFVVNHGYHRSIR